MKFLDCTIRDGGYYNNWDFDELLIDKYYRAMSLLSDIQFVEIGYIGLKSNSYKGRYFWINQQKIQRAKQLTGKKIAALLDYKNYNPKEDLPKVLETAKYLDLLRIAVKPEDLDKVSLFIEELEKANIEIALNIMYCSKWHSNKIVLEKIIKLSSNVKFVYVVDSFGSILPDELNQLFKYFKSKNIKNLGFHAHDNLGLALANIMVCEKNGISIIDGTILGMGRGAGNLRTEVYLTYLNRSRNAKDELLVLAEILKDFEELKRIFLWGNSFPYVVAGAYNLPQADIMIMMRDQLSYAKVLDRLFKNESRSNLKISNSKPIEINSKGIILVGGGPSAIYLFKEVIQFVTNNDLHMIFTSLRYWDQYSEINNKSAIVCGIEQYRDLKAQELECPIIAEEDLSVDLTKFSKYDLISHMPFSLNGTGIALSKSKTLNLNDKLFLIGYDGYHPSDANNQLKQNDNIQNFKMFGKPIISLSKTTYSCVEERSIHEYI